MPYLYTVWSRNYVDQCPFPDLTRGAVLGLSICHRRVLNLIVIHSLLVTYKWTGGKSSSPSVFILQSHSENYIIALHCRTQVFSHISARMLTLYFLQTSRAIRTAWLLEELNMEYDLKSAERTSDSSIPPELGVPTDF